MLQNTVLPLLWAGQYLQLERDVLSGRHEKSSEPGMAKALTELLPLPWLRPTSWRGSPNSVTPGGFAGEMNC